MALLKLLACAAVLVSPSAATADPLAPWATHIAEASNRFGVPADWIQRVIRIESGGQNRLWGKPVVSRAGAMGLMQLMPGTWREMRAALRLGEDPNEPRDNILAGSYYLRLMYDRFGYPGLFGAYNAGPARYDAWLAGRKRLPGETVAYLARAARDSDGVWHAAPRPTSLFAGFQGFRAEAAPAQPGLFVRLNGSGQR